MKILGYKKSQQAHVSTVTFLYVYEPEYIALACLK